MNKKTREAIRAMVEKLEELQPDLEQLLENEQEKLEALPDSFQGGPTAEAFEEAISNLEQAEQSLQELMDNLNAAVGG